VHAAAVLGVRVAEDRDGRRPLVHAAEEHALDLAGARAKVKLAHAPPPREDAVVRLPSGQRQPPV
jgi:hypothetical protein